MSFVYLLVSTSGSTYVGATVDLTRRLRQHNKEIKGGAHATGAKVAQGVIDAEQAAEKLATADVEVSTLLKGAETEAEGIVARPKTELNTRGGHRLIAKIKCRDFAA